MTKNLASLSRFFLIPIIFFGLGALGVFAAAFHNIPNNTSQTITEFPPSVYTTNNCTNGIGIMVPTTFSTEWSAFQTGKPSCVAFQCLTSGGTLIPPGNTFTGWNMDSADANVGQTCSQGTYTCTALGAWSSGTTPSDYCDQYGVWTSGNVADTCDGNTTAQYTCGANETKTCVDEYLSGWSTCAYVDGCGNCQAYYTSINYRNITCRGSAGANCIAQTKNSAAGHSYSVPALTVGQTLAVTSSTYSTTASCGGNTVNYNQSFNCNNGVLVLSGGETTNITTCGTNYTPSGAYCVANTTSGVACGGSIVANATASTASTYTQTWSCGIWTPVSSWSYGTSTCGFTCKANYTWNGASCVANTQTVTCGGSIPAYATASTASTYTQTWNGSAWAPVESWNQGGQICGFQCNSGYGWNGTACVASSVNGVCDNPNYGCISGTFVDDLNCVGAYYEWHCNGSNGGTSATCQIHDTSCGSCFPAGTKVTLADGTKQNIETIQSGQKVESYDEKTGKNYTSSVLKAIHHDPKAQIIYTFVLGDGKTIEPNSIHPLYEARSGKYFKASELYQKYVAGEKLELLDISGKRTPVEYINPSIRVIPVYNLHVNGIDAQADDPYGIGHNYYVNDTLVHNKVINPPSTCLMAGTKILMADGTEKNIEDIKVGEKIVTYNEILKQNMTDTVLEAIHNKPREQIIYTIQLSNGNTLRPNNVHSLFEVNYGGYQTIDELYARFSKGEQIDFMDKNSKKIKVISMKSEKLDVPVYNLHVTGIKILSPDTNNPLIGVGHSYYANGILSHNAIFWIDQSDIIDSMTLTIQT